MTDITICAQRVAAGKFGGGRPKVTIGVAMYGRDADDERLGALMRAAQRGDGQAYLTLLQEIAPRVRSSSSNCASCR